MAKGLCSMHYARKRQNGSPYAVVRNFDRHGKSQSKVYRTWQGIIARCNNHKHVNYMRYGGRGVTVCEEWGNSFPTFYRDMGDPPTENYQIDRKDNDKGYSKDNCRWVLPGKNSQNRRSTKLTREDIIAIRQSNISHKELADMYNVSRAHINRIINRVNWRNV